MKKTYKSSIAAFASLALLAASANAAIIFTDTFDSGTGSWYKAGTANTLSNSSGQLLWDPGSNDGSISVNRMRQVIGRSFTSQTVTVGETIRLTFNYTQSTTTSGNIFRVGLYDTATAIAADGWSTPSSNIGAFSGYSGFFRDNGTTNPLRTDSGTDTNADNDGPLFGGQNLTTLSGDNTTFDILANTQYRVLFDVTRTSATQMDVVLQLTSLDGLTVYQNITGSTSIVQDSFDAVALRSINPILIDNVQLSVIPEPGTALLGGLGLLALLRRRR